MLEPQHKCFSIDPGEKKTGYCLLTVKNLSPLVFDIKAMKIVFPGRVTDYPAWDIAQWHRVQFLPYLLESQPNVVVLEYPALAGHRLFHIGNMHAAYAIEVLSRKIDFIHMPNGTWKFLITNNGHATPIEYRDAVNKLILTPVSDYDEAAAIGMGIVGFKFWLYKKGLITLSKVENAILVTRKIALDKRKEYLWRFYEQSTP